MLNPESEKPLYLQLVDQLEGTIRQTMKANDQLFSERTLTQVYGVSRMTVRLALQELEKRGLVYKKHGKGTYVADQITTRVDLAAAYSFTDHMRQMGRSPQTILLSFESLCVSDSLGKQLQLDTGEEVFVLERLRLADGIPMMFERSYLPAVMFPGLTQETLSHSSLYEVFARDYAQVIRLAEEECYASIALDYEAGLLQIPTNAPVLHLVRKTYNAKNRMIEYTFSIARADQFRYKIRHRPDHN